MPDPLTPPVIFIAVMIALAVAIASYTDGFPLPHRRADYAGCAMPQNPALADVRECREWQAEKRRGEAKP